MGFGQSKHAEHSPDTGRSLPHGELVPLVPSDAPTEALRAEENAQRAISGAVEETSGCDVDPLRPPEVLRSAGCVSARTAWICHHTGLFERQVLANKRDDEGENIVGWKAGWLAERRLPLTVVFDLGATALLTKLCLCNTNVMASPRHMLLASGPSAEGPWELAYELLKAQCNRLKLPAPPNTDVPGVESDAKETFYLLGSAFNDAAPRHTIPTRGEVATLNPLKLPPSNPPTLHPQHSTLNPQPSTLNPQPSTLNPQFSTQVDEHERDMLVNRGAVLSSPGWGAASRQPWTLPPYHPLKLPPSHPPTLQHCTFSPQPSPLNPQPSTLIFQILEDRHARGERAPLHRDAVRSALRPDRPAPRPPLRLRGRHGLAGGGRKCVPPGGRNRGFLDGSVRRRRLPGRRARPRGLIPHKVLIEWFL